MLPPVWSNVWWGGGYPLTGPMSSGVGGDGGGGTPQVQWTAPLVNRQTENITFHHTPCVGGNNYGVYQLLDIANYTLLKQLSHSTAESVCKSCTNRALCRYVRAWLLT